MGLHSRPAMAAIVECGVTELQRHSVLSHLWAASESKITVS
jgi:hypothetical protein